MGVFILILLPIVLGADICEDKIPPGQDCIMLTPILSCATNYTIFNQTSYVRTGSMTLMNSSIYYFTFNETKGSYIVTLCDNSTREMIVEGDDDMGSIAITMFILSISAGLFMLPFFTKFTQDEVNSLIMRRGCYVLGIYLMMLNSAMMATISKFAGLGLEQEMLQYMWVFGLLGYMAMAYLIYMTIVDILRFRYMKKQAERNGDDIYD